jgi:hypothetical protein
MCDIPARQVDRRGRTLKVHLVDDTSSGVIAAGLGVSSGRVVIVSRTALANRCSYAARREGLSGDGFTA